MCRRGAAHTGHTPANYIKGVKLLKVWLYYRLSRDEDSELNSLTNQRKILVEYAETNNHIIAGESFDDNVSGMHFNREGIEKIYDEVEKKNIDAVIVKDLSRLGRHRTQTAIFIDYLRENDVRVLSVTENIDTSNEDDDLIVGFKGIFNDMYARDISKKIRAGYRQKQKDGMVLIPPMGYFKDKNTNQVVIVEETAEIVRRIFNLYVSGYGIKAIAKMLNADGIKSAGYWQKQLLGKNLGWNKPEIAHRFLWENTAVKRILQNEFYTGTVVCHKSYTNKINKIRKDLPESEHFRHENLVPAIISKEVWNQVQFLLGEKVKRNVRAGSGKPYHRYAGLIKCGDCGSTFVSKTRKWRDKPDRIEYNCNGYHRYGKEHCTPHRVNECDLDKLIYDKLILIKGIAQNNWSDIESELKKWMGKKNTTERKKNEYESRLAQRQSDLENILMERIRDREHADVYTVMLEKCEIDIAGLKQQIDEIRDFNLAIKRRKTEMKQSIEIIDEIVSAEAISDTHLRMLVDEVAVSEKDNKLQISISLKAMFRRHQDYYNDKGEITERIFESWCLSV